MTAQPKPGKRRLVTDLALLERARAKVKGAKNVSDLREALTVVLPARLGLTLQQTAEMLGRSQSWVADARHRFADQQRSDRAHGGRRNQTVAPEEEAAIMDEVCRVYIKIHKDWRLGAARGPSALEATRVRFEEHVRLALESRAGRPVSRATAYNVMARVGKQRFQDYAAWKWRLSCERSILT